MKNQSQVWASFQIGIDIVCILISVAGLTQGLEFLLSIAVLFVGIVSLIDGYLATRNEQLARYQILSAVVSTRQTIKV